MASKNLERRIGVAERLEAVLALALAALMAIALASCRADKSGEIPTDWQRLGLSGRVRLCKSRVYYATHPLAGSLAGTPGLMPSGYSLLAFTPEGRLEREEYYRDDDSLASSSEFKRDERGALVSARSWTGKGEFEYSLAYSYGEGGRLEAESYFDAAGARTGGNAYEYDDAGRLVRKLMDNSYSDGTMSEMETLYLYDGQGRLTEERFLDESMGGLVLSIAHAYVGDRRAYSSHYQRGSWLDYRVFYEYDEEGNVVRETGFQIPESADSASYEPLSSPDAFPTAFLISIRETEYSYYPPAD